MIAKMITIFNLCRGFNRLCADPILLQTVNRIRIWVGLAYRQPIKHLWDHSRASLGDFWRKGPLVLVFLRHYG